MKAVVLGALLLVGMSAFAERESSGKVPSYVCDDGIADGGFTVSISDLSASKQHVVIMSKSKKGASLFAADALDFRTETGKFRVYSNSAVDSLLEMTISIPNAMDQKSVVITYQSKISTVRIPEQGNLICERRGN